MIIVSYFTQNTYYAHEANKLGDSILYRNLPHKLAIEPRESRGFGEAARHQRAEHFEGANVIKNWAGNNHIKADVIRSHLKLGGDPVLWIDADCLVFHDPADHLAPFVDCDFAAPWRPWPGHGEHIFASTLLFNPTQQAIDLCDDWILRCAEIKITRHLDWKQSDQLALQRAVEAARERGLKEERLPVELAFVHSTDRERHPGVKPAIVSYQVSDWARMRQVPGGVRTYIRGRQVGRTNMRSDGAPTASTVAAE